LCLWGRDIIQQLHKTLTMHKTQPWGEGSFPGSTR
jgi:hypothetical protein